MFNKGAKTSIVLLLPNGTRKLASPKSTTDLLVIASKELKGGEAKCTTAEGVELTSSSPLPPNLSLVTVTLKSGVKDRSSEEISSAAGGGCVECAICLETFIDAYPCVPAGPCRHGFHESCIGTWKQTSLYCPLCRGPMWNSGSVTEGGSTAGAPAASTTTTVVVVSNNLGSRSIPPPSLDELAIMLLRVRNTIQSSPEFNFMCSVLRQFATPAAVSAAGHYAQIGLRLLAQATPGVTGAVARGILSTGITSAIATGISQSMMAGARGGIGPAALDDRGGVFIGPGGRLNCPHCRTLISAPPGAPAFECGSCRGIIRTRL